MREEINYSELGNCIIPAFVDEINHLALKENAFTKKSHKAQSAGVIECEVFITNIWKNIPQYGKISFRMRFILYKCEKERNARKWNMMKNCLSRRLTKRRRMSG